MTFLANFWDQSGFAAEESYRNVISVDMSNQQKMKFQWTFSLLVRQAFLQRSGFIRNSNQSRFGVFYDWPALLFRSCARTFVQNTFETKSRWHLIPSSIIDDMDSSTQRSINENLKSHSYPCWAVQRGFICILLHASLQNMPLVHFNTTSQPNSTLTHWHHFQILHVLLWVATVHLVEEIVYDNRNSPCSSSNSPTVDSIATNLVSQCFCSSILHHEPIKTSTTVKGSADNHFPQGRNKFQATSYRKIHTKSLQFALLKPPSQSQSSSSFFSPHLSFTLLSFQ